MIFFRVTENINIKTTDGTLVKYFKLKNPSNLFNETVYATTYEDFKDLKKVFSRVDEDKYQVRVLEEKKVTSLENFPKELGIENKNEFNTIQNRKKQLITQKYDYSNNLDFITFLKDEQHKNLDEQIKDNIKLDIKVAIIGSIGVDIGETVSSLTAFRLFYEKLKEKFKTVKIDIFINASENKLFTRDKMIYENQTFINRVVPLSLDVKTLCSYDYYVDTSLVKKNFYYEKLNFVDAWLYKLGIDFTKVDSSKKFNIINLDRYKASKNLEDKIQNLKVKGKTLLYHPFTASANRTIPIEIVKKILKKILKKLPDYSIVTTIKIDLGIDDDRLVDLSTESKSILDFAYIISNMDKIITADTATYHISDAFFIPTVVIFTDTLPEKRIEYFPYVKAIKIDDKSKNLSFFNFDDESFIFNRIDSWKNLKIKQIIKLLA